MPGPDARCWGWDVCAVRAITKRTAMLHFTKRTSIATLAAILAAWLFSSCGRPGDPIDPVREYPCGLVVEMFKEYPRTMHIRTNDGVTHVAFVTRYDVERWNIGDTLPCR